MALVSCLFGGCGAHADFSVASVESEPLVPHARRSLHVSSQVSPVNDARLAVAVADQLVTLGVYDIRNTAAHDDAVRSFTVKTTSDKTAFARIGYAWGETPDEIVNLMAPKVLDSVTFMLIPSLARLAAGSVRTLRIVGVMTDIGALNSSVKSGHVASVTLVSLVGMDNVNATLNAPLTGPAYVVRRSQPFIVAAPLMDTALRMDKLNLMAWSVRADLAGDLSVKQFGLRLDLHNVEMCEFQLRRNTRLAESNEISVNKVSAGTTGLDKGCLRSSSDLAVTFTKEEVIRAGMETVFTLRARIIKLGAGASVMSRFLRIDDFRTKNLACITGQALRLGYVGSGVPAVLWSDLSAKPHSDAPCHSSQDWIGDALLADLSGSQLLK